MDYLVKRELHHSSIRDNVNTDFDVVKIYNKLNNNMIAETDPVEATSEMRIEYDGLEYVTTPNKEILITLESLINKFKKHE